MVRSRHPGRDRREGHRPRIHKGQEERRDRISLWRRRDQKNEVVGKAEERQEKDERSRQGQPAAGGFPKDAEEMTPGASRAIILVKKRQKQKSNHTKRHQNSHYYSKDTEKLFILEYHMVLRENEKLIEVVRRHKSSLGGT